MDEHKFFTWIYFVKMNDIFTGAVPVMYLL